MVKVVVRTPFEEIDSIPPLVKDFLESKIPKFEQFKFSKDNLARVTEEKSVFFQIEKRNLLVEVLETQQFKNLTDAQIQSLEKLKSSTTFTVCTGHQLNLFSGPVFFIYKILQTVKTAAHFKELLPDYDFVPIFWMATEDHDFEEINFFNAFDDRFETTADSGGAVGKLVPKDLKFKEKFKEKFKDFSFGGELISLIDECYQEGKTFAEATRNLVQKLFGSLGILIIDGDDERLKRRMAPVFEDELKNQQLQKTTASLVEDLKTNYSKVQVNPRELNLFHLSDKRQRIDAHKDGFILAEDEQIFSKDQILEELHEFPHRFSPNALMRPVFQEMVLPNVAYIGGNAEIMYWLELVDYFNYLKIPFPLLIPRSSLLFLTQKQVDKLEKLNIDFKHVSSDPNSLINEKLLDNNEILDQLEKSEEMIASRFQILKEFASKTDVTFGNLVQAEQIRQLKSVSRMKKRLLRAEKRKNTETVDRIRRLFDQINPGEKWQERSVNFAEFYATEGADWLKTCLTVINPEESELITIQI